MTQKTIDIRVGSKLYGRTTCVVNVADYKNGRETFPCGDGCDYTLTIADKKNIDKTIKGGN